MTCSVLLSPVYVGKTLIFNRRTGLKDKFAKTSVYCPLSKESSYYKNMFAKILSTFFITFMLAILGCLSQITLAADLALYYTANSFGQSSYCKSCGEEQLGGLARRLTAFESLKKESPKNALFLAGPYEFLHYRAQKTTRAELEKLLKIFSLFPYDLGICSQLETRILQKYSLQLPQNWTNISSRPKVRVLQAGSGKIGLVIFPQVNKKTQRPKNVFTIIDSQTKRLKDQVTLTIGISCWGYGLERRYIMHSQEPVNILLGSGPGPASKGKILRQKQTAWARSYPKGKAIVRILIKNWPSKQVDNTWLLNKNIFFDAILLNSSFVDAPQVKKILTNK